MGGDDCSGRGRADRQPVTESVLFRIRLVDWQWEERIARGEEGHTGNPSRNRFCFVSDWRLAVGMEDCSGRRGADRQPVPDFVLSPIRLHGQKESRCFFYVGLFVRNSHRQCRDAWN